MFVTQTLLVVVMAAEGNGNGASSSTPAAVSCKSLIRDLETNTDNPGAKAQKLNHDSTEVPADPTTMFQKMMEAQDSQHM